MAAGRAGETTRSMRTSPDVYARTTPGRAAVVMARSGEVVTYRELEERSNRLASRFRSYGLAPGDHIAVFMENPPRYLEVVWAAQRSGLYFTPVNSFLA